MPPIRKTRHWPDSDPVTPGIGLESRIQPPFLSSAWPIPTLILCPSFSPLGGKFATLSTSAKPSGNRLFLVVVIVQGQADLLEVVLALRRGAAASRTFWTAGSSRPIRIAMMAMTTSSSIRVNPNRFLRFAKLLILHSFWS